MSALPFQIAAVAQGLEQSWNLDKFPPVSVGGHSRPKSEEIRWAMSPLRSAFDVTKQIRVLPVNHGPGDHGRLALVVELHAGYAHLVSRIENNFVSGQEGHGRQVDLHRIRNSFDYEMVLFQLWRFCALVAIMAVLTG